MNDEIRKYGSSIGDDAVEYVNNLLSEDEKEEMALEVQLMRELAAARKEKKLPELLRCSSVSLGR